MPTHLLSEQGHDITVLYANSNIAPRAEYEKRLVELEKYASAHGFDVVEAPYRPDEWERAVAPIGEAALHGFEGLSSTLAVSPYQFTDVIADELQRAADAAGVRAVFEDFRPYYDEATRISREQGMYRQNYCGCRFSVKEGEATRAFVKQQRALAKAAKAAKRSAEEAASETARKQRAADKRAYADKQARKRAILKQLRNTDDR